MRPLTFGVYPGGVADQGLLTGLPNDFERADAALIALQGPAKRFIVRCYDSFQDLGSPLWAAPCAPKDFGRYAKPPARPMDLVLTSKWDSTPHPRSAPAPTSGPASEPPASIRRVSGLRRPGRDSRNHAIRLAAQRWNPCSSADPHRRIWMVHQCGPQSRSPDRGHRAGDSSIPIAGA
jgi:hypothetical protein